MKKNLVVSLLVLSLVVVGLAAFGAGGRRGNGAGATSAVALPAGVAEVVLEALVGTDGEYAAYATYAAILEKYGDVQPYANIMKAEARHIAALQKLLDRYGIQYPTVNPYLGKVAVPASLPEAAQAGIDAEKANVSLYEEQMAVVAEYPDIVRVFTNLQAASQNSHLSAFERALASGGTSGR
ncbi:MAG: DUF2202 domain-containing protein [Candidatus Bipolaricaulis sp.]|nr:DUF2202 domain-containing protein [Candidatus Bipolaricaulis sp.]MDD5220208.1 DUF2202 domain-containing protein [Candidatus Bipolaricaulis sp.]